MRQSEDTVGFGYRCYFFGDFFLSRNTFMQALDLFLVVYEQLVITAPLTMMDGFTSSFFHQKGAIQLQVQLCKCVFVF